MFKDYWMNFRNDNHFWKFYFKKIKEEMNLLCYDVKYRYQLNSLFVCKNVKHLWSWKSQLCFCKRLFKHS